MKSPQEEIRDLELKLPVNSLRYKSVLLWPLLKPYLFFRLRNSGYKDKKTKSPKIKLQMWAFHQILASIKSSGIFGKTVDVLISSDSFEGRDIEGSLRNKIFFQVLDQLGERASYFERPVPNSPLTEEKNVIPLFEVILLAKLAGFFSRKFKIEELSINAGKIVGEYRIFLGFWRFCLWMKKPKLVLLSDYYNSCHLALITAARERNIPVVEYQHGIITRLHPSYDFPLLKSRELFPDFLASYLLEKEIPESFYLPRSHALNSGHPYLFWAMENKCKNPSWAAKKVVLVTLQYGYFYEVIKVISEAAGLHSEMNFVMVPRMKNDKVIFPALPNLFLETDLNFYQCLPFTSVHVTYSSTCTLEAFMVNIPSIVIELDSVARKYYGQFDTGNSLTYVETAGEFSSALKNLSQTSNKLPPPPVDIVSLFFPQLRRATSGDSRFVYDLRFSPDIVNNSASKDVPSFETHDQWFQKKVNSPDVDLLIVMGGKDRLGVVRYDWKGEDATISIFLNSECRGLGLGKKTLILGERFLLQQNRKGVIFADVQPGNISSVRMFESCGYTGTRTELSKVLGQVTTK